MSLRGIGDNAGVAGVNAVDVGENLAEVGLDGGGDGDGGEVGAAAAEGGDAAVRGLPLEAGDDDDGTIGEGPQDGLGLDIEDAGLGVAGIGEEAGLRAGHGDGLAAHGVDGHAHQGDGGLFAGGEQHIHLARAWGRWKHPWPGR